MSDLSEWRKYWESKKNSDPYRKVDLTESSWYSRFIFVSNLLKTNKLGGKLVNKLVLDIGCGTGLYTRYLIEEFGSKVIAVDFAEKMLKDVDTRAYKVQAALPHLPFKNDVFDAVLCIGVFQYISDLSTSLAEINRVLKKGGVLYFTTLNSGFILSKLRMWKNIDNRPKLIRRSKYELEKLLEEAGFNPVVEYIPVLPFTIRSSSILFKLAGKIGMMCASIGGYATKE